MKFKTKNGYKSLSELTDEDCSETISSPEDEEKFIYSYENCLDGDGRLLHPELCLGRIEMDPKILEERRKAVLGLSDMEGATSSDEEPA